MPRIFALRTFLVLLGLAPASASQAQGLSSTAPALYSPGDPTNDEQYILELINRARADPAGEGLRLAAPSDPLIRQEYAFFAVNTALLQSGATLRVASSALRNGGEEIPSPRHA